LRKLLSTNVTGVHSDEGTTCRVKINLLFLEDEPLLVSSNGITDLLELCGTHREYLSSESVELIEAYPRTRGSDTSENVSHGNIVHLIGAVEHIARLSESIG
jgi:hypothetical protein